MYSRCGVLQDQSTLPTVGHCGVLQGQSTLLVTVVFCKANLPPTVGHCGFLQGQSTLPIVGCCGVLPGQTVHGVSSKLTDLFV